MTWHPTLEDYDDDWRGWQRNQCDYRKPSPRWPVLGSGRCWCGQTLGHDWPAKAQGAPHPRAAPDGLNPLPAPETTQPSEIPCPRGTAHSRQAIRRPAAHLSRRHLS